MSQTKTCKKCHRSLSILDFKKVPRCKDGRNTQCRDCVNAYKRAYYAKNATRLNQKQREKRRLGAWNEAPRDAKSALAKSQRWAERNPEKRRALNSVQTAIRNGSLQKLSCFACGNEKTEAHHAAYSLPLAVSWLCRRCHTALHIEHRDLVRATHTDPQL